MFCGGEDGLWRQFTWWVASCKTNDRLGLTSLERAPDEGSGERYGVDLQMECSVIWDFRKRADQ